MLQWPIMGTNASSLKLAIELIPEPCWGRNLRSVLPDRRWTKISREVREAAGGKCQICGGTSHDQCDEQWTYDDKRRIQRLTALRAVCQMCHNLMNLGRTSIIARQMDDRSRP
jgi:5-methylcytosine-specific restriction endonuclease McrA